jgi:hypothetical protein
MIQAICTCGDRYEIRDDLAGKKIRCLTCSGFFYVPGRPSSDERPAARARSGGNGLVARLLGRGGGLVAGAIGGAFTFALAVAWVRALAGA